MHYMNVMHKILVPWKTKMKELLSMKEVFNGEKSGNAFGEDGSLKIVDIEFCRRLKLNF